MFLCSPISLLTWVSSISATLFCCWWTTLAEELGARGSLQRPNALKSFSLWILTLFSLLVVKTDDPALPDSWEAIPLGGGHKSSHREEWPETIRTNGQQIDWFVGEAPIKIEAETQVISGEITPRDSTWFGSVWNYGRYWWESVECLSGRWTLSKRRFDSVLQEWRRILLIFEFLQDFYQRAIWSPSVWIFAWFD